MANIPSSPTWSPDVYQIETTDAVLGGPDGVINVQAKQLADRTDYLKQQTELTGATAGQAETKADQALAQIDSIEIASGAASESAMQALVHKQAAEAARALAEQARNAAQAAQGQASDNAGFAYQAAQTAQMKALDAQAAATAAVSASGAAAGARDAALQAKVDTQAIRDGAVAEVEAAAGNGVDQIAAERDVAIVTAEAKKAEIVALAAGSMVDITVARDATVAAKVVAETKAADATQSAATATTAASTATTQANLAASAKTAAEAARDAALIQAGVYVDEPTGRAAVANGVAFKVQGSGDVAAYEYRRVNATTVSTLIATYPAKAAYDSLKTIVGNGPKTGTFSATLMFDDDEIVDSYLQTAAITFTLAASGHKLGVSKRITIIGDGSGISFGFTIGVQQGTISPTKLNTLYMVYVGNSTVDLHIVNSDTALSDTTNLLALVQADSASKLTLSGSNVTAMIDQSPQQSNFAVVGTMPYDSTGKFITISGARFSISSLTANRGNFTLVLAGRFLTQIGDSSILAHPTGAGSDSFSSTIGIIEDIFGRGRFQSHTDALSKLCGDSVLVLVGDSSSFRAYVNNVLIAEKTTGGPYTGAAAIAGLFVGSPNYTIQSANRLYEFRLINKAYMDSAQLTQLYNDVKNRYGIDPTIYPTLSDLTYTGTPVAGGTITAAWTYNQNAASPIGRYRIEWRWDSSPSQYWFYMYSPGGKTAINDPVSPAMNFSGKYWKYRITVQDDQGRCSKVAYESPAILNP